MSSVTLQQLRDRISKYHNEDYSHKNCPNFPLKRASVLIPLVWRDGCWQILLTLRSENVPINKGQVAFPGGKYEPGDKDEIDTALREAEEEVGLSRHHVQEVLGILHPVASTTNFLIHPVVAVISPDYIPNFDQREVADIFYVPLARFLSAKDLTIKKGKIRQFEVYFHYFKDEYAGKTFTTWGLTSMLCCCLATVAFDKEAEFDNHPLVGRLNPDNAFIGLSMQVQSVLDKMTDSKL